MTERTPPSRNPAARGDVTKALSQMSLSKAPSVSVTHDDDPGSSGSNQPGESKGKLKVPVREYSLHRTSSMSSVQSAQRKNLYRIPCPVTGAVGVTYTQIAHLAPKSTYAFVEKASFSSTLKPLLVDNGDKKLCRRFRFNDLTHRYNWLDDILKFDAPKKVTGKMPLVFRCKL